MTTMYGIANCDTIKKAKKWLAEHDIAFTFEDYKKISPKREVLESALQAYGEAVVLNKRGTTYRKLSDAEKANINDDTIIDVLTANASMIKRPILKTGDKIVVGFSDAQYREVFNID